MILILCLTFNLFFDVKYINMVILIIKVDDINITKVPENINISPNLLFDDDDDDDDDDIN
jgi:hypothetical protein